MDGLFFHRETSHSTFVILIDYFHKEKNSGVTFFSIFLISTASLLFIYLLLRKKKNVKIKVNRREGEERGEERRGEEREYGKATNSLSRVSTSNTIPTTTRYTTHTHTQHTHTPVTYCSSVRSARVAQRVSKQFGLH